MTVTRFRHHSHFWGFSCSRGIPKSILITSTLRYASSEVELLSASRIWRNKRRVGAGLSIHPPRGFTNKKTSRSPGLGYTHIFNITRASAAISKVEVFYRLTRCADARCACFWVKLCFARLIHWEELLDLWKVFCKKINFSEIWNFRNKIHGELINYTRLANVIILYIELTFAISWTKANFYSVPFASLSRWKCDKVFIG